MLGRTLDALGEGAAVGDGAAGLELPPGDTQAATRSNISRMLDTLRLDMATAPVQICTTPASLAGWTGTSAGGHGMLSQPDRSAGLRRSRSEVVGQPRVRDLIGSRVAHHHGDVFVRLSRREGTNPFDQVLGSD